ncbi:hypothetical protein L596_012580 [Steinernema carpocapsae]|uniref:Aldehyde dehydrogenase domain-containing protein n=1 Tax=Steinernema carpocapsae TaxID=34508 RepID=A0A4U5NYA9_STECR|nr:hypothetical protein L596_012580 [Steinernema carpocapsae]
MDFGKLVAVQREYFNSGATKNLATRKEHLNTLKKCCSENADKICEAIHKDLRRNPAITKQMEIYGSIGEIDYLLAHLDEWAAPQKVAHTPAITDGDIPLIVKDPLGVVLIIGPWNYPAVLFFRPVAAALAAGNTAIVKPSEIASHTSNVLADIVPKYFDKKVVAVVEGAVDETTALLKERFDHILYTGAPPVGKIVMAAAAKHLTPVTLELGGKCPVVVADDADVQLAAKKLASTKWLNCGQTCIAPDYVLTSSKVKGKLVEELKKCIEENFSKDPKASPMYSRMVNQRHFDRVKGVLDKSAGQVLYKGGEYDRNDVFILLP